MNSLSASSLRLSGSLLTPSTVDEVVTSTCTEMVESVVVGQVTPPSVERLRGAYQKASLALATENFSSGFPNEPPSWERQRATTTGQLECEDDRPLERLPQGQYNRLQDQVRRILRDFSTLRQDVDTVMMLSSKSEAQQEEASRNWSLAQANLAKESMDLLIQVTEEQKSLKEGLKQEATSRAQMAESIARDRDKADVEIVGSIRQVVEQGAAFREAVLKEAAEQKTTLAKDIQSSLEATLEQRIAEFRAMVDEGSARCLEVERGVTALNQRWDSHESILVRTLVDGVAARCLEVEKRAAALEERGDSHDALLAAAASMQERFNAIEAKSGSQDAFLASSTQELRDAIEAVKQDSLDHRTRIDDTTTELCNLESLSKELHSAQEQASDDRTTAFIEQSRALWKEFSERISQQLQQSEEAVAVVAENLQEEVKERTLLNSRLRSESDQRTKVLSAVWLEVANVQQQVAETREMIRLDDFQGQISQYREASESRHSTLISSLEEWKEKTSTSFEKFKADMTALRDRMTDHMSWVATTHEAAVVELKQKVANDEEQISELFMLVDQQTRSVSRLQDVRSSSDLAVARRRATPSPQPQVSLVPRRLASGVLPTEARVLPEARILPASQLQTAQLQRPVSPMRGSRSLPQPPSIVEVAVAQTNGASITVTADVPLSAGNRSAGGALQRVPSAGFLSARFAGPARADGRRL